MKYILLFGFLFFHHLSIGQKKVAITIDDIPNSIRFEKDGYQSALVEDLDSLAIPIAIFINEGFITRGDSISKNSELLNQWAQPEYITLGNHSLHHSRYSDIGIDSFAIEVVRGEAISRQLALQYRKPLQYFDFPTMTWGRTLYSIPRSGTS